MLTSPWIPLALKARHPSPLRKEMGQVAARTITISVSRHANTAPNESDQAVIAPAEIAMKIRSAKPAWLQ